MSFAAALVIGLAVRTALAGFASAGWDTSGDGSQGHIIGFQTTLEVPALADQQGLFIWPGMYYDGGLVQSVIGTDGFYIQDLCNGDGNQNIWCLFSADYTGGDPDETTANGQIVQEGDMLDIVYSYDAASNTHKQYTLLQSTGQLLSSLTTPGDYGLHVAFTVECHANFSQTPAHRYTQTTIKLDAPNLNFNTTLSATDATPASFSSRDDGTTWYIDEIDIDQSSCIA